MLFPKRNTLDVSQASTDQLQEILKYASDIRKFEIERFWSRSAFFWTFIGASLVAYGVLDSHKEAQRVLFAVSAFGFLTSLAWTLQNRGSKYWQEAWEQKVNAVEISVLGAPLFSHREPSQDKGFWGASEFSVSKLAIAISDATVSLWVLLFAIPFWSTPVVAHRLFGLAIGGIALIYGFIMLAFGGTSQKKP